MPSPSDTCRQRWIFTKADLHLARAEDHLYASALEVGAIGIWCANSISLLSKRLQLRQRVAASATVFVKRFYAKNSYCATDPCLLITAAIYVAAKAEESPVHIRSVVAEAARVWTEMGYAKFPQSASVVAEMEFYLLEELEFDLIIHHPYRTLVQIATTMGRVSPKEGSSGSSAAGNAGDDANSSRKRRRKSGEATEDAGSSSSERALQSETDKSLGITSGLSAFSADEPARLDELDDAAMQMAWFVLNDTYRSDLPLLYPPHLIALAAVFLAFVLHPPACEKMEESCKRMKLSREAYDARIKAAERERFLQATASSGAAKADEKESTGSPQKTSFSSAARGGVNTSSARNQSSLAPPSSSSSSSSSSTAGGTLQQLSAAKPPAPPADALTVLASMNVSLSMIADIVHDMLASYELWHRVGSNPNQASAQGQGQGQSSASASAASSSQSRERDSGLASFVEAILPPLESPEHRAVQDMVGNGPAMLKRLERMREARRQDLLKSQSS